MKRVYLLLYDNRIIDSARNGNQQLVCSRAIDKSFKWSTDLWRGPSMPITLYCGHKGKHTWPCTWAAVIQQRRWSFTYLDMIQGRGERNNHVLLEHKEASNSNWGNWGWFHRELTSMIITKLYMLIFFLKSQLALFFEKQLLESRKEKNSWPLSIIRNFTCILAARELNEQGIML